jgi:glycosyltransferase involved in cell wall biosynthesis
MTPATRILFLAPCSPAGSSCGIQMRVSQVAKALQAVGRLDCVIVSHDEERTAESEEGGFYVRRIIKLRPIAFRSLWERLRCGLDRSFVNYHGQMVRDRDRMFFMNELPRYDLVWLHNLSTANFFDRWVWPRSVMDLPDIPSSLLRSAARYGGGANRLRAAVRLHVARSRERQLAERFTVLSVCSDADRQYLGLEKESVHVIPNGFVRPNQEPSRQAVNPPRLGFIGLFGYAPNLEGIQWFTKNCWPRIKREIPDARLRLVGKGSDGISWPTGIDIDALGWVDDSAAEIATWSVMVVPIRTGGGTRIKIAEGFSRKCPIVSTSVGAYGYEVANGRELLMADAVKDFAAACLQTIHRPTEAAAMAERAWKQFLAKWTWEAIRPRVWAAAEDCLRQRVR